MNTTADLKARNGIIFHKFDMINPDEVSTVKSVWDLSAHQPFMVYFI